MEKLNIAEILNDCPSGMELDCTMFDNVTFVGVNTRQEFPIEIKVGHITKYLTKEGCYHRLDCVPNAKCVIFPKGKTTWEGFQRPFEDGDIVAVTMIPEGTWIGIFKKYETTCFESYCSLNTNGEFSSTGIKNHSLVNLNIATKEEKQKLFDVIKANGYKWNTETKTLEKLIEPKFKVGDKVRNKKYPSETYFIVGIYETKYDVGDPLFIDFKYQDNYELVPNKFDINTLKPFDKVLVRDTDEQKWIVDMFGFYDKDLMYPFNCIGHYINQCIPYKNNEHLLGTTNDCDEYYKTWE